ncbi:MAG: FAD binding domain-containing protein [Gemmatimonadota bacterium]|nr:MAG: FAD binding domain-containing protein [Gemmatimonadota bacterium]
MLRLPAFTYLEPKSVRQALRMKQDAGPDGMYVAGGTDLYPNMKRRHQEPKVVISLAGIRALSRITGGKAGVELSVGAGVTLTALHTHARVRKGHAALAHAAELVSTPLLRNMGTFGGNLCLDTRCNYYNQTYEWRKAIDFCMKKDGEICWVAPSSPRCWAVQSSDTAPVAVALGAELVLAGPDDERIVPAGSFFNDDGIRYLTKHPDEIVTEVRLPATDDWDATYWKLRRRGTFDFPVLGVAAWIRWDGSLVADARIVLGAVASYPLPVPEAARAVIGTSLDDDAIAAAAAAAFKPSKPMDNTDFGLAWRKEMTRVYVRGALEELRDRRRSRKAR